jgi:hypothetical protein
MRKLSALFAFCLLSVVLFAKDKKMSDVKVEVVED